MQIVVNHVTRMDAPRICAAGIEPQSLKHVRPTTPPTDRLTRKLLREEGGPFGMGAVVDLGEVAPTPSPPEVEDHRFRTANAGHIEDLAGDEFLALLDKMSSSTLADAFGPALERVGGWKLATERGAGDCSLAVVAAKERPKVAVDPRFGRLQLRFADVEPPAYVPVNDIRFYESDHRTIKESVVEDVRRRLRKGIGAYLMFGLARPYKAPHDDRERHWLQLNGICLEDRAVEDAP
jgi:hypothetical protein